MQIRRREDQGETMDNSALFQQHRSVVMARRGMVATAHPLASNAGLAVLREGGNAADAALAAAAVCGVTLCGTNGIGGDMFCLYYDAKTQTLTGFNGNGAAGSGAAIAELRKRGFQHMPARGPLTVTVPGAVDAYSELHKRFGTMPMSRLFADAIYYAKAGHPVSERVSAIIAQESKELGKSKDWAQVYMPRGRAPQPGEILTQPDLARSLQLIAEGGRDAYYRGELGRKVVETVQAGGGFLVDADLEAHATDVYTPINTTYRGRTIHETRPPSHGFIVLEMLNLLEHDDLASMGFGSAGTIHRMVEAKKLAFADRWAHMGDPRFVDAPTDELISKPYAARRRRDLNAERAAEAVPAGSVASVAADTTYLCTVDEHGNAASFIHTLYQMMGSGVMVPGTGIVLTNRGRAFVLDESHPNWLAPGKRTMHTLNCYMAFENGELILVGGTPGADSQPQWNVQVLTDLFDFGMNVQQAAEAPRWVSVPGSVPAEQDAPYELQIEEGFEPETLRELEQMGHRIVRAPRWSLSGSVELIRRDPATGTLFGGSDPRTDGAAVGF